VHFGVLPDAEGWCAADAARPDADLLGYIRPLRLAQAAAMRGPS